MSAPIGVIVTGLSLLTQKAFFDTGVCPTPSPTVFDPRGPDQLAGPEQLALGAWKALYPEARRNLVAYVMASPAIPVEPWQPWMVSIERNAKGVFIIRYVRGRKPSSGTSVAETVTDPKIAEAAVDVWKGVVRRAQYFDERYFDERYGPPIGSACRDGVYYFFWINGRSATAHCLQPGTILWDFVELAMSLGKVANRERSERDVAEAATRLARKIQAEPPCLELRELHPSAPSSPAGGRGGSQ